MSIRGPDYQKELVEKSAKRFIDFLRQNQDILLQNTLGGGRLHVLTQIENCLIRACSINEKERAKARKIELDAQADA